MKQSMLLAMLCLLLLNPNYANNSSTELTTIVMSTPNDDDECDELEEAATELKKEIAKITEAEEEGEKSELEKLKAELDRITAELAEFSKPKSGPNSNHGPGVVEKRKALEQKKDAARTAYYEKLAQLKKLEEQLLEKLRKRKKDCAKDMIEAERNKLDQDIDDHDDQPEALERKKTALEEDALEEELERLKAKLAKEEGETEAEYRARLRKYKAKYPWLEPEKEEKESRRDFRKRKKEWDDMMDEKWRKDFWKKIQEEIRRRIDEKIKESDDRERELPDDEGALPRDDREENYYYSFRLGYTQAIFNRPFSGKYEETGTLNEMQQSIYEDPDLFAELFEELGGEFFLGTFSSPPEFVNQHLSNEYRYGLSLSQAISRSLESSMQLQYGQAKMEASFPVTVIDLTDGESQNIMGSYTLHKQALRAQLGLNYRFGENKHWQPLMGLWLGTERQNWRSEASIESVSWELSESTNQEWSYGLHTALRWQSSGALYGNIHGQWGQFTGGDRLGVGFSVGVRL